MIDEKWIISPDDGPKIALILRMLGISQSSFGLDPSTMSCYTKNGIPVDGIYPGKKRGKKLPGGRTSIEVGKELIDTIRSRKPIVKEMLTDYLRFVENL